MPENGLLDRYCRTGFDSSGLADQSSLSLIYSIETMPILLYMGVIFPYFSLPSVTSLSFLFRDEFEEDANISDCAVNLIYKLSNLLI